MFKVGEKIECIEEQEGVYVELGEIVTVVNNDINDLEHDIRVEGYFLYQFANSKNFKKVGE